MNKPNQKFLSNYFVIHSPTCFYNDKNNSKVFFNLNKYLVYSSHEHKNISPLAISYKRHQTKAKTHFARHLEQQLSWNLLLSRTKSIVYHVYQRNMYMKYMMNTGDIAKYIHMFNKIDKHWCPQKCILLNKILFKTTLQDNYTWDHPQLRFQNLKLLLNTEIAVN